MSTKGEYNLQNKEIIMKDNKSKQDLKHGSSLNKAIPAAENEINKAI